MSRSAKGTVEQPGKNVRAKAGLNKAIVDQGWGELIRQLSYKQQWRGGIVVLVPPQYTSQKCSKCGRKEHTRGGTLPVSLS
jgi:putative transposase